MNPFVIFYVTVSDDEDGFNMDGPYFGGKTSTKDQADAMAKVITNNKSIPGVVITKILPLKDGMRETIKIAQRQFDRMAEEMHEMDQIQRRMKKR